MGVLDVPKIDIAKFIEQSGVRRARFGGLEEADVRAAMRALCSEYEKSLSRAEAQAQRLAQEKAALEQHCRTLAGQNHMLSGQNATLAGNSERYARQSQDLDTRVSSLQERNHSLNDQIAVLRLKNSDLEDENASLKARADQAEAALKLRGKELATEKAALQASRQQKLDEAAAEAAAVVDDARVKAQSILEDAQKQAAAIDQTAREQARKQAQNIVDAATEEAHEIQNANQLRLNEIANEVRQMEARRAQLIEYLNRVGSELLRTGSSAPAPEGGETPAELPPLPGPEPVPEFTLPEAPEAELDLSPDVLAAALQALRGEFGDDEEEQQTPEPMPEPAPEPEPVFEPAPEPAPEPVPEPEPEPAETVLPPQAEEPRRAFPGMEADFTTELPLPAQEADAEEDLLPEPDLSGLAGFSPVSFEEESPEPVRQTAPGLTEIPGAIFSSPIVQPEPLPYQDDAPPEAVPRKPVLPVLPDLLEEEDDVGALVMPADPAAQRRTLQRRKAVLAVRAIRRMSAGR